MKFWSTKNSNFFIKSVSFCRKNSYNFFGTNYEYINLLYNSYYDKVSKYGIAKIGVFGGITKWHILKAFAIADWIFM